MPLRKTTLIVALSVLYFGPGLLFFYVLRYRRQRPGLRLCAERRSVAVGRLHRAVERRELAQATLGLELLDPGRRLVELAGAPLNTVLELVADRVEVQQLREHRLRHRLAGGQVVQEEEGRLPHDREGSSLQEVQVSGETSANLSASTA